MTTTTETIETSHEVRRSSAGLRFLVAFLIGLVAATAIGVGALYAYDQQYSGRVLPGVAVGVHDLGGMNPDAASAALANAYAELSEGRIVVMAPDGEHVITYADIGRRLDTQGLVAEALAVGRSGSPLDRAVADTRTAFRGVTLSPRVTFDADALARRVAAIAASLAIDPADASIAIDGKLSFNVTTGSAGRTSDPIETTTSLAIALAQLDAPAEVRAILLATTLQPRVTTAEAVNAKAKAERIAARIDLVDGTKPVTIATTTLRAWVSFQMTGDGYQPVIDTTGLTALVTRLATMIDRPPLNASFQVEDGKIAGVTDSQNGQKLDVPAVVGQIGDVLASRAAGAATTEIVPVLAVTEPVLTTDEAKAAAPQMVRISSWKTYFQITEKNGLGVNIWIPTLIIDGYVVGPRETFDFWGAIGPVTREKGYLDGGAIINGKTEPQGALAGGICSTSTTLFNAALRAGFEMGARRNHYYYIDRYPLGLDATVFISASGSVQTMSWTNDTDYPVLIRGYKIRQGNAGWVKFELYSVPSGRQVVIDAPIVKNIRPATDSTQLTSTLAPGAQKRIEYPVDGKQVWRTVTVYDRDGGVIRKVTYYSNYSRVTGVVLVGQDADTTDPPGSPLPTTPVP